MPCVKKTKSCQADVVLCILHPSIDSFNIRCKQVINLWTRTGSIGGFNAFQMQLNSIFFITSCFTGKTMSSRKSAAQMNVPCATNIQFQRFYCCCYSRFLTAQHMSREDLSPHICRKMQRNQSQSRGSCLDLMCISRSPSDGCGTMQ